LPHILAYRYSFEGPCALRVMCSNDGSVKGCEKVYDIDGLTIFMHQQTSTEEVSSTKPSTFEKYYVNVDNSKILRDREIDMVMVQQYRDLVLCDNSVIACSDVTNILEHCLKDSASKKATYTVGELESTFATISRMVQAKSFSLEHDLCLNLRLIEQFSKIAQPKGFIVDRSLPQDTATIYGKSQPDLTIYKSDGGYIRGNQIVGATIKLARSMCTMKQQVMQ